MPCYSVGWVTAANLQVECSPESVSANNPDAVLINREQVVALNTAILAKGQAKLDLMKQMKEFKRGIYQLEWENKKIDMQVRVGKDIPREVRTKQQTD